MPEKGGFFIAGRSTSFNTLSLIRTDIGGNSITSTIDGGNLQSKSALKVVETEKNEFLILGNKSFITVRLETDPLLNEIIQLGNEIVFDSISSDIDRVTDFALGSDGRIAILAEKLDEEGYSDYYLLISTSDFEVINSNSFGNIIKFQSDFSNKIVSTPDNGYIITGTTFSNSLNDTLNQEFTYIVKTNSMGEKLWDKLEGIGDGNWSNDIISSADGSIALIHEIQNSNTGGVDYFFKKLSSSGSTIWERKYGDNRSDFPTDLKATIDGGFILVGNSEGDIFVLKTNANGLLE